MTTFLIGVHILIETDGPSPRSDIVAALEAHLNGPATPVPASGSILDWSVAGKALAASIAPAVIPSDYRSGTTRFPQWPAVAPKGAAS